MANPAKEIIFVGRSNVGKSTLIRALTGKNLKVGRRPGVTRKPQHIPYGSYEITDMPGFGFMSMPHESEEAVKDSIVRYIEDNASNIVLAVLVVNAGSFAEIVDRWAGRNEIPLELELYEFLNELDIDVVVVANKIDKIKEMDKILDGIAQRLGMMPPWRQWLDKILPVSAKKGSIGEFKRLIQNKLSQI